MNRDPLREENLGEGGRSVEAGVFCFDVGRWKLSCFRRFLGL